MPLTRHTLISLISLLIIGCTWGATMPLTRIAVSTGHQPMGLIFWQLVIAVVFLGAVLLITGLRPPLSKRHLTFYGVIALVGTLFPNSFSYMAAAHLPAGIMAIAIATVPMMTLMIALSVGNESFSVQRLLGVCVGVLAMILIALPESSLPDPEQSIWVLVALIAPIFYGIEGNYVDMKSPPDAHPVSIIWAASVIGMIIAAPYAWISGDWVDLGGTWQAPEWALIASSLAHAVAYSGFVWLVGYSGVVFSTQIAYVVTLSAIAVSIIALNESYSGFVWVAVVLMVFGLSLVQPIGKLPEEADVPKEEMR